MPELDPFDARLEHAAHAFADRAQTSVDAVAVAGRAIGHRQTGVASLLSRAVPVPVPLLAVAALVLAFAGWSLSGGGPFPVHIWLGPVATPTASPTPTPTPTPSPTPTVAPTAPALVTGTGSSTGRSPGAATPGEGGIAHWQGIVIDVVTTTDDPRVNGTGTFRLSSDASGQLGFTWGTFRLDAAGGSWEGTCTGAMWEGLTPFYDGLAGANQSCWLQGTGSHAGMTFYLSYRFAGVSGPDALLGTIAPAEPPSQ